MCRRWGCEPCENPRQRRLPDPLGPAQRRSRLLPRATSVPEELPHHPRRTRRLQKRSRASTMFTAVRLLRPVGQPVNAKAVRVRARRGHPRRRGTGARRCRRRRRRNGHKGRGSGVVARAVTETTLVTSSASNAPAAAPAISPAIATTSAARDPPEERWLRSLRLQVVEVAAGVDAGRRAPSSETPRPAASSDADERSRGEGQECAVTERSRFEPPRRAFSARGLELPGRAAERGLLRPRRRRQQEEGTSSQISLGRRRRRHGWY